MSNIWLPNLTAIFEQKNNHHLRGDGYLVEYSSEPSIWGQLAIASTPLGICYLAFSEDEGITIKDLHNRFPAANLVHAKNPIHEKTTALFQQQPLLLSSPLQLHLIGSEFQLKVWQALLQIPFAEYSSYLAISHAIGHSKAYRAVGTAVGQNPVSILVPCHRVIKHSGKLGAYHWGIDKKKALLDWEMCIETHVN